MTIVFALLYLLLLLFFLALMVRLVFDWVQMFARDWRPKSLALVAASGVYSVTDPPLRLLRRLIPPLQLGSVSLDLGFLLLLILVGIAMSITQAFAL
ncbi:YggT family protein [Paenarthrobacter sp. PH39-S1]|uniref:YggT family protein n=1 Tax=Micrococcaceae TaxID=1268 RepID=UPI0024BBC6A5|nr:YggT family protein [Paenarthrobacter sp. PH39-S1]MDJ0356935.1 YggT family protein [Paenarthrobacter sp. PH39-S1]